MSVPIPISKRTRSKSPSDGSMLNRIKGQRLNDSDEKVESQRFIHTVTGQRPINTEMSQRSCKETEMSQRSCKETEMSQRSCKEMSQRSCNTNERITMLTIPLFLLHLNSQKGASSEVIEADTISTSVGGAAVGGTTGATQQPRCYATG